MPSSTTAEAAPSPSHAAAPPWTGELRDVVELGRGGMGVVWLVLDERGRTFARKTLLPELARSDEKRELFLREAKVAIGLFHPNVVRTHVAGSRDGAPYLVMDFVDGVPLDALLACAKERDERMPRRLAALLVARVARGLHAAHELRDEDGAPQNLVHRDVSPQNVMVSRAGEVVLLDFGVAKIDAAPGLTKTGEVRGKTAYMSPEQGLGDPLDRRSDLFSLGALLYECVENTRMWGGTEMEVLRKLALDEAPRLPGGDRLSEIHASLVERARERRPATALEVAVALESFANDDEVEAKTTDRDSLAGWVIRVAEAALDVRASAISNAIDPPSGRDGTKGRANESVPARGAAEKPHEATVAVLPRALSPTVLLGGVVGAAALALLAVGAVRAAAHPELPSAPAVAEPPRPASAELPSLPVPSAAPTGAPSALLAPSASTRPLSAPPVVPRQTHLPVPSSASASASASAKGHPPPPPDVDPAPF